MRPFRSPIPLAPLLFLAAALAACGSQSIDSGNATHTTPTSSGTTTGTGTDTTTGGGGAGGHAAATGSAGAGGAHVGLADVRLVYGATTVTVDVATLATEDYKGSEVVPLSTVWGAGKLGPATSKLQFDFEGDDGFHPSMKGKCAPYIPGAELAQGYVLPGSRSLVWDDALGLPGCYSVQSVATIIGLDTGK